MMVLFVAAHESRVGPTLICHLRGQSRLSKIADTVARRPPSHRKVAGSYCLKYRLYSAPNEDSLRPNLAMNFFRFFRNLPQQMAARVRDGSTAHSKAAAIETLRRFQDGKLNGRDSDAVVDALLRFHEGSLTEEELVDIAAALARSRHVDGR